jgi:GDP-4-dehydro-6-deoxy-D-mannose reductase
VPGPPLVTGATGFAGSHLVEHLLQFHPAVAAWGRPGGTSIKPSDARIAWREVDVLDREAVAAALAELGPSAVYHCAGSAHVGDSWSEPVRPLQVNVLGTHHVLDGLARAGLDPPVLVTGSAMIYRRSAGSIREEDPIGPATPYGVSKLAQEMLACRSQIRPVYIVRPFNHAGPRQSSTYVTSSFARQIAEIEAQMREPVLRVGNLESRRDITDVRDTVRAYRLLVARGQPRRPYNVCSGRAYRIRHLLDALVGLARIRITVEIDQSRFRPLDNPVILGDPSRVADETGWTAELPIERTLRDLLDYWRGEVSPVAPRA